MEIQRAVQCDMLVRAENEGGLTNASVLCPFSLLFSQKQTYTQMMLLNVTNRNIVL